MGRKDWARPGDDTIFARRLIIEKYALLRPDRTPDVCDYSDGKINYPSYDVAEQAAHELASISGRTLRWYPCRAQKPPEHWHLTSSAEIPGYTYGRNE